MAMPRTMDGLPTEILDNIFIFVRATIDQRSVCLVSHRWCNVMTPQIFRDFKTDMRPTPEKQLTVLTDPKSRILKEIRKLTIGDECEFLQDDLISLLVSIPSGQLISFTHEGFAAPLSEDTLRLLLQRHTNLDALCATGVVGKIDSAVLPHVASIRAFSAIIPKTVDAEVVGTYLQSARNLIKILPKINDLRLRSGSDRRDDFAPMFEGENGILHLPGLEHLTLQSIQMTPGYDALLNTFDISKLHTLYISCCVNVQSLLDPITKVFAATNSKGALRNFQIWFNQDTSQSFAEARAVERFLSVCPPLSFIQVGVWGQHKIDVSCVFKHARTLRTLVLVTGAKHPYAVSDVQRLLGVCTRLEQLGLDLPMPKLGSTSGVAEPVALGSSGAGAAHVSDHLETFLTILATHERLEAISLLSLPVIEYGSTVEVDVAWCRDAFLSFSTEVLRFMAENGSNVRVLNMNANIESEGDPDADGQTWPNYTYKRYCIKDAKGVSKGSARPLLNARRENPALVWLL